MLIIHLHKLLFHSFHGLYEEEQVLGNEFEVNTDIEMVNEYTSNLGLTFKLREYDTWKYSDDRDIITSLPAFHIYVGEGYVDTFYPGDNMMNRIDETVKKYEMRVAQNKRMMEAWKNIFKIFWKNKLT